MQHLYELADRANMLYTAEDISAVFDCHPCHVVDLWQLGIIDVADGLLLLYPDFRTPCWVLVNPVLNAAIDEFRRSGELKAVVQARRQLWCYSPVGA